MNSMMAQTLEKSFDRQNNCACHEQRRFLNYHGDNAVIVIPLEFDLD